MGPRTLHPGRSVGPRALTPGQIGPLVDRKCGIDITRITQPDENRHDERLEAQVQRERPFPFSCGAGVKGRPRRSRFGVTMSLQVGDEAGSAEDLRRALARALPALRRNDLRPEPLPEPGARPGLLCSPHSMSGDHAPAAELAANPRPACSPVRARIASSTLTATIHMPPPAPTATSPSGVAPTTASPSAT